MAVFLVLQLFFTFYNVKIRYSFHKKIFDKVEEGKRDKDPHKCRQIIDDLMKLLKHLTADVNNYNSAFRDTRPPFYMQVSKSFDF